MVADDDYARTNKLAPEAVKALMQENLAKLNTLVAPYEKVAEVKLCTEVIRDGKVLVSGHVWLGCVDKNFRISRIPPEILKYCKMCTPQESEQL